MKKCTRDGANGHTVESVKKLEGRFAYHQNAGMSTCMRRDNVALQDVKGKRIDVNINQKFSKYIF